MLLLKALSGGKKTSPGGAALDMAAESIDDMYDGCRSEAASMIDLFGVFEWHFNRNFSLAWASAERGAKKPAHQLLTEDHATVVYMYTKMKHIQQEFDKAVKTGKHKYSTYGFMYHYLYFYLTDAIQALRHGQAPCRTAFHRTRNRFSRGVVASNMRFGAFTLGAATRTSLDFSGNASCFEIYTCLGADVTYYSAANQTGQVLIPPFEVFRITDVRTDDPRCSVVYKLESTKTPRTDLNCKLSPHQIQEYFGALSTQWHKSRVGNMFVCLMLMVIISFVLVKRGHLCYVAAVMGALLVLIVTAMMLKISQ
ncbi:ecto-ADP-ribosyltransferase 4-like isoform X2 [Trachinotus anak]|uniref:ecto-ADP-ribosyltransferase 4-like isoform X2 n=1 Tax=Trachinotus anak TaxID=443729 RepID=UPI0039F1B2F8